MKSSIQFEKVITIKMELTFFQQFLSAFWTLTVFECLYSKGKAIGQSALQKILQFIIESRVGGPKSFLQVSCLGSCVSAMEELVAVLRSLADDVENNRVEDTDAVDRVLLWERMADLSLLVRFDASVLQA